MRHPLVDVFVGVAVVVAFAFAYTVQGKTITYTIVEEPKDVPIEVKKVELRAELKPICACESIGNRNAIPQHFKPDGGVIRGVVNQDDIGICQINLKYHGESAEKMGLDLFAEQDNITYANRLYEQQGSQPWYLSKSCWGA